ncbi:MAG: type III-B CRISPR-associated protein Cas10/Cmr2 [Chloroflexota bacterium]|nr:type III-B CRISPR-associated protein Cas10/Cmr2 [Chloroflexota bacterium]
MYDTYRAGPAEQLSGVDLLKRQGQRNLHRHFASTSHIAALPLMLRLAQVNATSAQAAWKTYINTLEEALSAQLTRIAEQTALNAVLGAYEGDLLFEERLIDLFDPLIPQRAQSAAQQAKLQDKLTQARAALKVFFNELDPTVRDLRPAPYYAILLADGDRMGRVINNQDMLQHQTLSRALDEFADKARDIVEQTHFGALVYAGGDDVLAFVPLHTVLACATELATVFATALAGYPERAGPEGQPGKSPTLSVGIVVAHHLEPLSDTLALARAAEKAAKAMPGKNALAITISKRSGSDTTVAGPQATLGHRLRRFVALHRHDKLPDGAAYELRDLALRLWVPPAPVAQVNKVDSPAVTAQRVAHTTLLELMATEAARIVGRKRGQGGSQEPNKQLVQNLDTYLRQIAAEIAARPQMTHSPLAQLADELIVAREFARAATLAGLPKESLDADLDH